MNCGDSIGNAASYVKELCRKRNFAVWMRAGIDAGKLYCHVYRLGEETARKLGVWQFLQ